MSRHGLTRAARGLAVIGLFLGASGCAQKADWIERTLVTVDVTGTWRGSGGNLRGPQADIEMSLKQRGAKVTGDPRARASHYAVEGIVRGDLFSFTVSGTTLRIDAMVTGDEMSGVGTNRESAIQGEYRLKMTRHP